MYAYWPHTHIQGAYYTCPLNNKRVIIIISYRVCAFSLCACVYWPHAANPIRMLFIEFLYIYIKPVIMYCICNYVCMHIGRIRVSNMHTIRDYSIAMCARFPY